MHTELETANNDYNESFLVDEEDNLSNLAKLLQICGMPYCSSDWRVACNIVDSQTDCLWHYGIPAYKYIPTNQEICVGFDVTGIVLSKAKVHYAWRRLGRDLAMKYISTDKLNDLYNAEFDAFMIPLVPQVAIELVTDHRYSEMLLALFIDNLKERNVL